MQRLTRNWITENHIDFEYKKYVLLAYLQHVSENFQENRLYPFLSDLVDHYRDLKTLKEEKHQLFKHFPERLKGADMEHFRMIYDKMVGDDTVMNEIESIIDFSLPRFEEHLREGRKIYDFLEEHTRIQSVGLSPLNNDSGYLLLRNGEEAGTVVYSYNLTVIERPGERFRGLHLDYVDTFDRSLSNTFESIKSDLIRFNRTLPNPAAYAVESAFELPFDQTFLPLAKRSMMRWIAMAA